MDHPAKAGACKSKHPFPERMQCEGLQTPFAALGVRVGVGMEFFFPTSFLRMFCSSCRPFMRCCECVAPMPVWVMHVCVCVWVMWAGMGDGWAWAICASVRMICR